MTSQQIYNILYNFIINIGLEKKGFVNPRNNETKYSLLYPTGVVLTVDKKYNDNAWQGDIKRLTVTNGRQHSKYDWAKTNAISQTEIQTLNDNQIELLIECKYIFDAIHNYVQMPSQDVSSALWGCVCSILAFCEEREIFIDIARFYKSELEKNPPFDKGKDFDRNVVPAWQDFLTAITNIDVKREYGTDFRNIAKNLPDDIKSDISWSIVNIGNTNIHRISCHAALQGAMISMIENYQPKNSDEERIKEISLQKLGKITKNTIPFPEPKGPTKSYADITPGTTVLSATDVNKISGANTQSGMNFGKRTIMIVGHFNNVEDGDIIYYEGHNVRKSKTHIDPFLIDQPRIYENAKFCDAVDAYNNGSEPAYINIFKRLAPNKWIYKGVYALIGYEYIDSHGRKVYKFKLKKQDA